MNLRPKAASTIHSRLLAAFLLVVLAPALLISAVTAWSGYQIGQQRTLDQLESVVTLKSAEIDMWIRGLETGLDSLFSGREIETTVLPFLEGRLSREESRLAHDRLIDEFRWAVGRSRLFSHLCLLDARGRIVASTDSVREGRDLSGTDYYSQGLQKAFITTPFYETPEDTAMMIAVTQPVVRPSYGSVGVLVGYSDISVLDRIMEEPTGLGKTGESFLVDANYVPLTPLRVAPGPRYSMTGSEGIRAAVGNRIRGHGSYRNYNGVLSLGVFVWLPILQVALIVEQNQGEIFGSVAATLALDLCAAFAAMGLAAFAASRFSRGIAGPLGVLSEAAGRITAGDLDQRVAIEGQDEIGRLAEAFNLMTGRLRLLIGQLKDELAERAKAEKRIEQSLAEKVTLLRELHHRTKNNMGVIIALLDLQAEELGDERIRAAFADTQGRIRSMALVHQKLYEANDLSRIDLRDYLRDLVGLIEKGFRILPERIAVVLDLEEAPALIDTAIPCGLILNELLSNALKHAFPGDRRGEIRIELRRAGEKEVLLVVSDDGAGFPAGFDPRSGARMGLQTVFTLAERQLAGRVEFDGSRGVSCRIRFRTDLYERRV
jgi:two-component sensor histidine kinase/HAMP domain-containing protein